MTQPANIPRPIDVYRQPETCIVQKADAELQDYVAEIVRRRNPQLAEPVAEFAAKTYEAIDARADLESKREQRTETLESATRSNNTPTTSEPTEPAKGRNKERARKRER
jgi:Tfp pilus assembly protein PilP